MLKIRVKLLLLIAFVMVNNQNSFASIPMELIKYRGTEINFVKVADGVVKKEKLLIFNLTEELLAAYSKTRAEFSYLRATYRKWKKIGRPDNVFHLRFILKAQSKEEIINLENEIVDSLYIYTDRYSIEKIERIEFARRGKIRTKEEFTSFCDYIIVLPSKYSDFKLVFFGSIPDFDKEKSQEYIDRFVKFDRRTIEEIEKSLE